MTAQPAHCRVRLTPRRFLLAVSALLMTGMGCERRFSLDELVAPPPSDVYGDTTYVLQQPVWNGFDRPTDILVGREPFVYVADAGNDRIAMLDLSGHLVGYSQPLRNPIAVAQDYRLDLLVCAEFDTVIAGTPVTFGAIYRIGLVSAGHDISRAPVHRVWFDPVSAQRRYTGIAVLADNSYYVARTGPNNASKVDPDDAVMLFDRNDVLQPRVTWPLLTPDGTGLTTISRPTAVATFPRRTTDFLFTQRGEKSLFRAQWITHRTTGDVTQWESYFTPARDGNVDFLRVSLFRRPEDAAVDNDGNIYIIDAENDSLYRFDPRGNITQAFGGPAVFLHPEGVAHFDRTLYIADTGNNRVLRFKLSTDIR
ncbi:MAG: hypothetical protein QHI48_04495 [Bacteroidota bacterium]|nr:hypothetical protein [Bacteroidota bacterium]